MTKEQLIAKISTDSLGVAAVQPTMGGDGQPEVVTLDNGKTVRKYSINVAFDDKGTVQFKNVPVVVFNEGQPEEEALLSQGQEAPKPNVVQKAATAYLDEKVSDGTFKTYSIQEINEEHLFCIATVTELEGNVMTQKQVMVHKPANKPVTHNDYQTL